MGYDRKNTTEGKGNKKLKAERIGRMKEGRSESKSQRGGNILVGKLQLCKPDV